MKNNKCSLKNHEEIDSISFCVKCEIYMCNKCDKIHSDLCQNHHAYKLNENINEIFTGFCKEHNHNYKLEFYCKTHNKLCCSSCITTIKDKEHGQHKECDVCLIKDIKDEKKNNLKKNVKYLEEISNTLEESIRNLKIIYEKINTSKEELKLNIQNIFTKIRNTLNEREDQLLSEVEVQYNNIFFKEDFIKQNEKLPNKIKLNLEKGKISDNDWNIENKLILLINNCINIENLIKDVKEINKKLKNTNNKFKHKVKINILIENDNNLLLETINTYGKIINYYNILEDSLIIQNNDIYILNIINWINSKKTIITKLLHRKSSNDDSYDTFHKLCDNQGTTLVLIKGKEGFIFGGYTPINWKKTGGWMKDDETFLFNLSNNKIFRKTKTSTKSIFCGIDQGPLFNYIGFSENGNRKMSQGEIQFRDNIYFNNFKEIIPNEEKNKFFEVDEVEVYQILFK